MIVFCILFIIMILCSCATFVYEHFNPVKSYRDTLEYRSKKLNKEISNLKKVIRIEFKKAINYFKKGIFKWKKKN